MQKIVLSFLVCLSASFSGEHRIGVNNDIGLWSVKTKFIGTPVKWAVNRHCIYDPANFFSVEGLRNKTCKLLQKKETYSTAVWKEICKNDDGSKFTIRGKADYQVNRVLITFDFDAKPKPFKEMLTYTYIRKCNAKEAKKAEKKMK